MILFWYIYRFDKCPLQNLDNSCPIHDRKPLMCALYPYPDDREWKERTWYCVWEDEHDLKPKRTVRYNNPKRHLSGITLASTSLYRLFNDDFPIEILTSDKYISEVFKEEITLQIKPLFSEMTRIGLLSPLFLEGMSRYTFNDCDECLNLVEKMTKSIPHTTITKKVCQKIFDSWEDSEYEEYTYVP